MDSSVKSEISQCIVEIDQIIREINAISTELPRVAQGIGIHNLTNKLTKVSVKCKKAGNNLRRIQ